jgi:hypothetical protein
MEAVSFTFSLCLDSILHIWYLKIKQLSQI